MTTGRINQIAITIINVAIATENVSLKNNNRLITFLLEDYHYH